MPSSTLGQSCLTLFELVIALVATHQASVCIQFPSHQHHVVFGIVKDFANLLLCPFLVFSIFLYTKLSGFGFVSLLQVSGLNPFPVDVVLYAGRRRRLFFYSPSRHYGAHQL